MARPPAVLSGECEHLVFVQYRRLTRSEIAGQDDNWLFQILKWLAPTTEQMLQDPLLDVKEVCGPPGQEGPFALFLKRLDQVADRPADCVFGREAFGAHQGVQIGEKCWVFKD